MKITKFVHSCLLVEIKNLRILIDPGRYSWESHLLVPKQLDNLSHVVLTHEHGDHYHEPALEALAKYSPYATIITNNDLAEKILALGLPNQIQTGSDETITVFEARHEPLPLKTPVPLNIGVHIGSVFTHPGDALGIKGTRKVLALPVSAPGWTNLRVALNAAVKLGPKKIVPIHDWHWHQKARQEQYARVRKWLEPKGIEFIELENGEPVEI